MTLSTLWFVLIAGLWAGFVVLEGFDFGVGFLHSFVAADDVDRRLALASIKPVWDGNEVWLIVAGAGMFAAFPGWYATMFSSLYLALVAVLVGLIVRGVAIEFRDRRTGRRWRAVCSGALVISSLVIPLLIGVALADLAGGLPINQEQEYVGGFAGLLSAYSLYFGSVVALLCVLHGAVFLALKTTGTVRARAHRLARVLAPVGAGACLVALGWTHIMISSARSAPSVLGLAAAVSAVLAGVFVVRRRDGWAFAATSVTLAGLVLSLFDGLYPRVMISTLGAGYDLTIANSASSAYTLRVMTVVAAVFMPLVLAYQGYTYYVFRHRLRRGDLIDPH